MADKIQRMKELSGILTEAGKAYYQEDREIMSNYEYDKLYDELESLEKETGIVLTGSPTTRVGYESVDELPKERHEAPMLSLDKTKKAYQLLMDELIHGTDPSMFNQGMMDLGAGICTPKHPDCTHCPVSLFCEAHASGTESLLPVNIKNTSKTDLYYITAILKKDDKYFLVKNKDGLLENLYGFVQYEVESPVSFEETFYDNYGLSVRLYEYCKEIKHVFSHRIWHMNVYLGEILDTPEALSSSEKNLSEQLSTHLYTMEEMSELPISTAHRKVCTQIP